MPLRSFTYHFDNLTNVSIPNTVHGFWTPSMVYQAFDGSSPPKAIFGVPHIDPITCDFTLTFGIPYSGRIILTASISWPVS